MHIYDPADVELPNVGLLAVRDPETQQNTLLDTGDANAMHLRKQYFLRHKAFTEQLWRKAGADIMALHTAQNHITALQTFFKSRLRP
ncbi:MAG: hypothetical protein FGM54_10665 [Chitinophagaceae bacterium]|nr:hypothetical protein [Chitinophagaceae bacterium]